MSTHRDSFGAHAPRKTWFILAGLVTLSLGGGTTIATMMPAADSRPATSDQTEDNRGLLAAAGGRTTTIATTTPAPTTSVPAPTSTATTTAPSSTTSTTTTRPATTAPKPRPLDTGVDPLVAKAIQLTNDHRAAAGCKPLTMDRRLNSAAAKHSDDMADNKYFSHTSQDGRSFTDRLRAAGYPEPGGENIAQGARSAEQVVQMWMDSPGHRANILNCEFKTIGMGVEKRGWYWTQNFGW